MPNGVMTGALRSGFEIGRATGGRGGIGLALKGIADRLKATRETEEAVGVLGQTERVKAKVKAEFAPPAEWKPTTKPEALEFEKAKVGFKPPQAYKPTTREEALGFERSKAELKTEFAEEKLSAIERKAIGAIRQMKAQNAPIEDINEWLRFEGLEPVDYADEIGAYQPAPPKKSLLKKLFEGAALPYR